MKIGPTKGSAGTELTVDNEALILSKDPNTHTHTHIHTFDLSGAGDLPQPGIQFPVQVHHLSLMLFVRGVCPAPVKRNAMLAPRKQLPQQKEHRL